MKFINVPGNAFNTIHVNDFHFYDEINDVAKRKVQRKPWQGFFCCLSLFWLSRSHALSIISRRSDKIRISPSGVSGILSETWPKRLHQITRKPKVFAEYASQPLDET